MLGLILPRLLCAVGTTPNPDRTLDNLARVSNSLGGKGVLFLSGDVSNVQAAVEAGRAEAHSRGLLARAVVIPRLHPLLRSRVGG